MATKRHVFKVHWEPELFLIVWLDFGGSAEHCVRTSQPLTEAALRAELQKEGMPQGDIEEKIIGLQRSSKP